MSRTRHSAALGAASIVLFLLAGCGGGNGSGAVPPVDTGGATGRVFKIVPGANATTDMIGAMVQAAPGDVIEFGCGYFELTSALQLTNTEDVLVKGCGRDRTVLSFKDSNSPEGILGVNVHGLTVQDLTILDTGGNGIELRGVNHGTIKRVRTIWSSGGGRESATPITADNAFANEAALLHVACTDPPTLNPDAPENAGGDTTSPDYTVSKLSGRYGIYPVASENILIEEAESVGASDAGIYVGQTNNAIIRNSRAAYNVFGFEIENVQGGEYDSNVAECNTGGFLIYDLDGLRQYGDRSRMHRNKAINNNTYNFTAGGFVGNVPPGSGMITLAYDRIDIFDNEFRDNNTGGIIHASYELFPEGAGRPEERRIDWYTEGMHVFRNKFSNNGNGLPSPTTNDLAAQDVARFLPALVGVKNQAACANPANFAACAALGGNGYRGAHIVWDGLLDEYDADCPYPLDAEGNPVPADARGKPKHSNEDPNPECHYNGYKFDRAAADNPRINPEWFASCIDADNEFADDSLTYSNFHGTEGLELIVENSLDPAAAAQFPADWDMSPHQCAEAYGRNLALLPPITMPPFVRSGEFDPAPSAALVAQLCGAGAAGAVNFDAARVNCPTLDQYHLFADPQDPRSTPNSGGVPFSLTSKLFSDYAVKYRVLFLPTGTKAVYKDNALGGVNATMEFPTGTIIAKTFAFAHEDNGTKVPVETRLLIKRVNSHGQARWDGMAYIWGTENGVRVARLAMGGGTASVSWRLTDVDSHAVHSGSTEKYLIPHANQCLSCHAGEDKETGSAPIGPKARFLNGAYRPESGFVTDQGRHEVLGANQIQYWCSHGLLAGCPANLAVDAATQVANVERVPVFNKPGDSGHAPDSPQDIEARARAYLEVNCQHCHNVRGFAASTGFYLDSFRPVDGTYGICKRPTATGQEGNGGRTFDIHPGDVADSIIPFRIGPTATTPAARMPPLARSVVDEEAHALLSRWIGEVVTADEARYPGSTSCAGN